MPGVPGRFIFLLFTGFCWAVFILPAPFAEDGVDKEVLYLTEPEKWSPNAIYQVTRIFVSNLNAKMAQRFCILVLIPRLREDINKNKRLHFALYQALKKSLYKPPAFFKGILLPLYQTHTCNLRERVFNETSIIPVIWHQSFLTFVQRCKEGDIPCQLFLQFLLLTKQ